MPSKVIQDESEVRRWYEAGMKYNEMVEKYREKYNLEVTPTAFSNLRARQGWERRTVRNSDLMPWAVSVEHRRLFPAQMLRAEGRVRAGNNLDPQTARKHASWRKFMEDEGVVVLYDPETEEGFHYVPPRPGIDTDLVYVPDKATGRGTAD